jgi:hypothetical protein
MILKRKRAITWALIGLGVAILALGTTLVLTIPARGDEAWFGHGPWQGRWAYAAPGERGAATEKAEDVPRLAPGPARGYGWMRAGHCSFLNPFLLLGLSALAIFAAVRHGARKRDHAGGAFCREDAVSVLRREFAEGRISEEEYRKRLATLQE